MEMISRRLRDTKPPNHPLPLIYDEYEVARLRGFTMIADKNIQTIVEKNRQNSKSFFIVVMFLLSSLGLMTSAFIDAGHVPETGLVEVSRNPTPLSSAQSTHQGGQGDWNGAMSGVQRGTEMHPVFLDTQYSDYGVMNGKINDLDLLAILYAGSRGSLLEETMADDHDNDGVPDLTDLDDDNDGAYDLLERFDGCWTTDPYDHDNDGVPDIDDPDDDNDGILEGPIDYEYLIGLGLDPRNVSTDRFVNQSAVHPWTLTTVGPGYLADQHPWDHDNDGVPDEDSDGSGAGRYDEDDDNDGRIDQFRWQCDSDNDGDQDYFDDDDDDDGLKDWLDANPYDASVTTSMAASGNMYDAAVEWTFAQYRTYSGGLNFVTMEAAQHPGSATFTDIWDGDLDSDGIPNFIDPDNDNDGLPDSSDTDDDDDGILDMFDPDDDNDGIRDVCWDIDTNGDNINDYTGTDTSPYATPGGDTDGVSGIDCEMDYDKDADDDRWRPFDKNYNGIWDWLDSDLGGTTTPDDAFQTQFNASDFLNDIDNDNVNNSADAFPLTKNTEVATWNCPTMLNPNPANPDPRCTTERASSAGFNDWDGDGIHNWIDVDDDGDGIVDFLDIDWDCDFDNDADLHNMNGSKYRDDGPNTVDSDIDGDGLENDIDWDDDNDGISDLYDPDDGNCGIIDYDQSDNYYIPWYPIEDGAVTDGTLDGASGGNYDANATDHWNLVFELNPFEDVMLDYNGNDFTTNPPSGGTVPEFYWFFLARWSPYNGGNDWDIDTDGDSLVNGLDTDQDGDGMPDWWDQDEGNDGILDVNDIKMGGSFDNSPCGWTAGPTGAGFTCGYNLALSWHMPLNGASAQFGSPYSTRPDANINQGAFTHPSDNNLSCASNCYHYQINGATESAMEYSEMVDNTDAYLTWMGLTTGIWTWAIDANTNSFPDEVGADMETNDVDGDIDGDGSSNVVDIDDDYDSIFDWNDVDDDNDGIWDFFEVDTDDDLDNDAGQNNSNFFNGTNCFDNDVDGNDQDVDEDGWYNAVWDRGEMSQGLSAPKFYDVDNDNDGVPDPEDPDDDNNGVDDLTQELMANCFWGEEQEPWDHDNDGIVNWADDDWDADGLSNTVELSQPYPFIAAWDHDNDGLRDDVDDDDDADGMEDVDEVLLWPLRYNSRSTNPWDHDDFGGDDNLANPSDPSTGPDVVDNDDDNDSRNDLDFDHLEETFNSDPCGSGALSSDWDHDNNCILDEDDKAPTSINLQMPDEGLWLDAFSPAIFRGNVTWINPTTSQQEVAPNLSVQVVIQWANNNTTALQTIDVLTDLTGNFSVGQFLYPETLDVGDNLTYVVWAEVTEMFIHNGAKSTEYFAGIEANVTTDFSAWEYFRSDEQPFWLDFKAHYTADWDRAIYDNRINHIPFTFEVVGGQFGNRSNPSNFTGFDGNGYRTDGNGFASLTFVQSSGGQGVWKQVRWNSTMDNGPLQLPGGFEMIIWSPTLMKHTVAVDSQGNEIRYNYTNTSMPPGDLEITGFTNPTMASEWPFPWLHGSRTDTFAVRVMHRMYIEGTLEVLGVKPIFYWNSTVNNGDGTYGNWATLFLESALDDAGISYQSANDFRPWPMLWDGNVDSLPGADPLHNITSPLAPFVSSNTTHWLIALTNGGDSELPPCGHTNPADPASPIRCEIIPEMSTGDTLRVRGTVANRTHSPWTADPVALQVDIDSNGVFQGTQETAYIQNPKLLDGAARFDYNWTWLSQYQAGTYGLRVDFTNSEYYFTGNASTLAQTGAYINATVVGTTDFQMQTIPRLYRNSSKVIEARLVDNSLQPVRDSPVNWTWSFDGRSGTNFTDSNGIVQIEFNISADDYLGNYTLSFEYSGEYTPADEKYLVGNTKQQSVWVVSRTHLDVTKTGERVVGTGDNWDLTVQVLDDNRTIEKDQGGDALSGDSAPYGGLVDVIFEGTDFNDVKHRRLVATLEPNAGSVILPKTQADGSHLCFNDADGDGNMDRDANGDGVLSRNESIGCMRIDIFPLDPQLLKNLGENSFLPDGFGGVNVILRFEEALPNEGCEPVDFARLGDSGKWDSCVDIIGSDHYRVELRYNSNDQLHHGFSLIGSTTLHVDDQVVYTSELDQLTGLNIEKPMIVTGYLADELGENLTSRAIRVSYEMQNSNQGPISCDLAFTDEYGFYSVNCPLENVRAGQAYVSVTYNAYDNNDAFRYRNRTVEVTFDVFSNSTTIISEVGPYRNSYETTEVEGYGIVPILYLKESFHIDGVLLQANGQSIGGKCLNIYIDPEENSYPIATIQTSEADGTIEWYSADPTQNPTLKGIERSGDKLEGLRTIRIAYEPDIRVPGGCDKETNVVYNSSFAEKIVLVRSNVQMQPEKSWAGYGENGYREGEIVRGSVSVLRDRMNLAVEGEQVLFIREYCTNCTNADIEWHYVDSNSSITNEQGIAEFTWTFPGDTCEGAVCEGRWRITAHFPGSTYFATLDRNISHEVQLNTMAIMDDMGGLISPQVGFALAILILAASIVGVLWYKRSLDRKRIDLLRGILTDAMMELKVANEYIAVIFNCYKDLVTFFRKYGFMKKVYETTREFENAVRMAFSMVPSDQLDGFLAIFEEARYSDHSIGPTHRDRAIQTLQAITASIDMALGQAMVERTDAHAAKLYGDGIKAGSFIDRDGNVIIQGQSEGDEDLKI